MAKMRIDNLSSPKSHPLGCDRVHNMEDICLDINDLKILFKSFGIDLCKLDEDSSWCLKHNRNPAWAYLSNIESYESFIDIRCLVESLQKSLAFVTVDISTLCAPYPSVIKNPFYGNSTEEMKIKADLLRSDA